MTGNRRTFTVVILMLMCLAGCRVNRPSDVLSPREMENFLYDYHLAQSVAAGLPNEERFKSKALIDWAFESNGIDSADFERSLVWYTRYPKEFAKIYKKLYSRIDEEYKQSSNAISRIEKRAFNVQSGDSVQLWYLGRTCILNTSRYMNKVTLEHQKDTTFHCGDTIVWDADITFVSLSDSIGQNLYLALSAKCGDTIMVSDTVLAGADGGHISLPLVLDSGSSMSSLRFQAYYLDNAMDFGGTAILSSVKMMRIHNYSYQAAPQTETPADSVGTPAIQERRIFKVEH